MRYLSLLTITILIASCGQNSSQRHGSKNQDTTMLEYPVLVFGIHNQCNLKINKEGFKSYSPNYLSIKFDEMAKEIIIEPSKLGKKEFYDKYADWMSAEINRSYLDDKYKFYWIDSNGVQRRLRVLVEPEFQPTNQEIKDTSSEKVLTRSQFDFFMKNLKYNPQDYYSKFLIKNTVPNFNGNYPGIEKKELSMNDYYAIFQGGYPFSYPRVHPFYFLAYKECENFTQFFIYNYVEAAGTSIYLVHLNDTGKKVFETQIWSSSGDGGDYYRTKNSYVTQTTAGYTGESGYWDDNPDKPVYRQITNYKFFFDKFGNLRKKETSETTEGKYPFDIYEQNEWFPEEK